eukprot:5804773-Alexandrium_andersonii.AAC.1
MARNTALPVLRPPNIDRRDHRQHAKPALDEELADAKLALLNPHLVGLVFDLLLLFLSECA